jgi:hypothetical protein
MNRTHQDLWNAPHHAPDEPREEPNTPPQDDRDEPRRTRQLSDGEILQRYEG